MKKTLISIMLATSFVGVGYSQTTTTTSAPLKDVIDLTKYVLSLQPTNLIIAPYGTYVISQKKFGYGVAGVYNFDKYIGAVAGIDHVDQFLSLNGGVQFQLPFTPFSKFPNFQLRPFTLNTMGTPLGGAGNANGGLQTINSAGIGAEFGHVFGGTFAIGGAYGTRSGAGSYSGGYINTFFGWKANF